MERSRCFLMCLSRERKGVRPLRVRSLTGLVYVLGEYPRMHLVSTELRLGFFQPGRGRGGKL